MLDIDNGQLSQSSRQFLNVMLNAVPQAISSEAGEFKIDAASAKSKHLMVVNRRFFGQGYGNFLPAVQAIRFDFSQSQWLTQVMVLPSALPGLSNIWQYMPAQAAACGASSVDWLMVDELLKTAKKLPAEFATLSQVMAGASAMCWYPDRDIAMPLWVAQQSDSQQQRQFEPLFDWLIST